MAKKSTMEFHTLKKDLKTRLATLSAPNVQQTDAVVTARKRLEIMIAASDGMCGEMLCEIETD